jgi:hypothetical protein
MRPERALAGYRLVLKHARIGWCTLFDFLKPSSAEMAQYGRFSTGIMKNGPPFSRLFLLGYFAISSK